MPIKFIMGDIVAHAPYPGGESGSLSWQQVLLLVLILGVMLLYGIHKRSQRIDY